MEYGLSPFILEDLSGVLRHFPKVIYASIFGSRAKNTYKNYSDIDIAIHAPDMSDDDFTRLHFEINELPIVFKKDVVHFDRLGNKAFAQKILEEEKTFYPAPKG